ncbi:hypothetical protein CLG96_02030 [Sphingomonas oleivorans]|uniref:Uncharacterized protein n=1 Tax=Sphingomonas oleivorans TaxID=1735121 RepID=A0A2T5G1C1_9SPHN|nr:hypothetical protein [Sphingomonas oleivorans]PTQ12943.1 hypothetical protein CLG96_02030 [Sphingomonas oleivorans]
MSYFAGSEDDVVEALLGVSYLKEIHVRAYVRAKNAGADPVDAICAAIHRSRWPDSVPNKPWLECSARWAGHLDNWVEILRSRGNNVIGEAPTA